MDPIRLNKFLAERVGISRREADEAISAGKVLVNDEPAVTGVKVDKNDKVCYNGRIVPFLADYFYLALNKPVGYVCSRKRQGDTPTVYELLPEKYQALKTVGRLDKDSSGLILLTNDGDFAFSMTHPKFVKHKVYEVELDRALEPLHQQMIADFGVELADGKSRLALTNLDAAGPAGTGPLPLAKKPLRDNGPVPSPAAPNHPVAASPLVPKAAAPRTRWRVEMSEGRNRQIRRTFGALGYTVVKLERKAFGKFELGNLKPGEYQELVLE